MIWFKIDENRIQKWEKNRDIKKLIKLLKNDSLRDKAIESLGRIGKPAIEPLVEALEKDYPIYEYSAKALGKIGKPAVEALLTALKDPLRFNDYRRDEVAGALGDIRDKTAVQPLIEFIESEKGCTCIKAARALGKIKDPRATEPIIALMKRSWEFNIGDIAEVLGEIADPAAAESLVALLENKNEEIRRKAAGALLKIGKPAIRALIPECWTAFSVVRTTQFELLQRLESSPFPSIVAALHDSSEKVRWNAARSLLRLKWKPDNVADEVYFHFALKESDKVEKLGIKAIEPLIEISQNQDESQKIKAVNILGRIGDPGVAEPLAKALADMSAEVRKAAARALAPLRDERTKGPLTQAMHDNDRLVRLYAAIALCRMGDQVASEQLINLVDNSDLDAEDLHEAVEVLGDMGDSRALKSLLRKLKHGYTLDAIAKNVKKYEWVPTNDEIGAQYYIGIGEYEKCVAIGVPAVVPLLEIIRNNYKSYNYFVNSCIDALGKIGDPRAIEPLIGLLGHYWYHEHTSAALRTLFHKGNLTADQKNRIQSLHGKTMRERHRDEFDNLHEELKFFL